MTTATEVEPPKVRTVPVVCDEADLREAIAAARRDGRRIGLVPTMGALHAGHLSLIDAAESECDFTVVSIFVNPTQFGPHEDYRQYPRPIESDLQACAERNVSLVFRPSTDTMYPPTFRTFVEVEELTSRWEGEFRPGHFRGVTTVVLKLLLLTQPDVAYFGRKDYQQQLVIRRMCRDLNVPLEIRTCPTVRDADGLAISSRNVYLSAEERRSALSLSRSLQLAEEMLQRDREPADVRKAMRELMESAPGVIVDYATIADPQMLVELDRPQETMVALVAARVGGTRLIDNSVIHLT